MHGSLLLAAFALAQEAVSLQVVPYGQVETAAPGLELTPNLDASKLDVRVDCGGRVQERGGPAQRGAAIAFRFELPVGDYNCKGSLSGDFADGTSGEMPLSFRVQMLPRLQVRLVPNSIDLAARRVSVTLDRAASKVEVTAIGPKGVEVGKGLLPTTTRAGTPITAEWGKPTGEAIKLRVKAFDEHGFWSELIISIWSYVIPHEDVVFVTNSSVIEESEFPKLDEALVEAKKVVAKYEDEVKVRLYVGGHTDTVGDAAGNQKLSDSRALAIAKWFKTSGFPGEIHYAGFGETGLAVKTGDEVDEARNRRVEYVLAGSAPVGDWEELD